MTNLDADYWNNRFINNDTPWDIGCVSPPLKKYFDQLPNKNISILIPGCGNSHEAAYLLANGFTSVTLIDISPLLTQQIQEKFSPYLNQQLTVITGNFFELQGQFDYIIEQTFFCALAPSLRQQYAQHMVHLLKPGAKLAGLFFNRSFEIPGPPFGGSIAEYKQLFSTRIIIRTLEACYNSIPPRAGAECFFIFEKELINELKYNNIN